MALIFLDRVGETTNTTGTGPVTMIAALRTFQTFEDVGNGNTVYYSIVHRTENEWEVGLGTLSIGASRILSRTQVLDGSSGVGTAVNFSSGTKEVKIIYPAAYVSATDTQAARVSTQAAEVSVNSLIVAANTSQAIVANTSAKAAASAAHVDASAGAIYLTSTAAYASIATVAAQTASVANVSAQAAYDATTSVAAVVSIQAATVSTQAAAVSTAAVNTSVHAAAVSTQAIAVSVNAAQVSADRVTVSANTAQVSVYLTSTEANASIASAAAQSASVANVSAQAAASVAQAAATGRAMANEPFIVYSTPTSLTNARIIAFGFGLSTTLGAVSNGVMSVAIETSALNSIYANLSLPNTFTNNNTFGTTIATSGIDHRGAAKSAFVTLTDGASIAWDMSRGVNFVVSIAGDRTLEAPTNTGLGQAGMLLIVHLSANTDVTWASVYKFKDHTTIALSTSINAVDGVPYQVYTSSFIMVGVVSSFGNG